MTQQIIRGGSGVEYIKKLDAPTADCIFSDTTPSETVLSFYPKASEQLTVSKFMKLYPDMNASVSVVRRIAHAVLDVQWFYDSRIPGWEMSTQMGSIGGNEIFVEDGKTVREVFTMTCSELLMSLLPRQFIYHFKMTLTEPTTLHLIHVYSTRASSDKELISEIPIFSLTACLRHLPLEVGVYPYRGSYPEFWSSFPEGNQSDESFTLQKGNHSTQIYHPTYYARKTLKNVHPKWLFRYLCLEMASGPKVTYVSHDVRHFAKRAKTIRHCRYAVRTWLYQLLQSYHNVNVIKTKTLHEVPATFVAPIKFLHHEIHRKQDKRAITYAVVWEWFKTLYSPQSAQTALLAWVN